jgi:hypothetical protein
MQKGLHESLARIFHEWSTTTLDMGILPVPRYRGIARWHAHLHGLVTSIHEISGLEIMSKPKVANLIPVPHRHLTRFDHASDLSVLFDISETSGGHKQSLLSNHSTGVCQM